MILALTTVSTIVIGAVTWVGTEIHTYLKNHYADSTAIRVERKQFCDNHIKDVPYACVPQALDLMPKSKVVDTKQITDLILKDIQEKQKAASPVDPATSVTPSTPAKGI